MDYKAGRELDALIAERVMCLSQDEMWGVNDFLEDGSLVVMPNFPSYSSDIAAAWEVVEVLIGKHNLPFQIISGNVGTNDRPLDFIASFGRRTGSAKTAEHAICLAALASIPAPQA
jgi:hypothetical protein